MYVPGDVAVLRVQFSVATDYSCALQRDILLQGRLYLSENWICFYSNIFRWETLVSCCSTAAPFHLCHV